MNTPAARVIEKCGGASTVAKIVGVHVSRVHRWTYPRERGGTGGRVPTKHQQAILDGAHRLGIELTPADFFDAPTSKNSLDQDPESEAA